MTIQPISPSDLMMDSEGGQWNSSTDDCRRLVMGSFAHGAILLKSSSSSSSPGLFIKACLRVF